jgi:tetratricopeptide (TPR) repeat protein
VAGGQPKKAEAAYRAALKIQNQLAKEQPKAHAYRAALAKTHNLLGALLANTVGHKEAAAAYLNAMHVGRTLVAEHPEVPIYRRDLAFTHNNLGLIFKSAGRHQAAEIEFREAVALFVALAKGHADAPDYRSALGGVLNNLARVVMSQRGAAEAQPLIEQAIRCQQEALKRNPRHPTYLSYLQLHYQTLAQAQIQLGQHRTAAQTAAEFSRVFPDRPEGPYQAACWLVQCLRLVDKDAQLSQEERGALAHFYGDRALEQLRAALQKGLKDVQRLRTDPALEPLRARADFQELVKGLEE